MFHWCDELETRLGKVMKVKVKKKDPLQLRAPGKVRGARRKRWLGASTRTWCDLAGRVRYRDRKQAKEAVAAMRHTAFAPTGDEIAGPNRDVHYYRCEEGGCGGWHIELFLYEVSDTAAEATRAAAPMPSRRLHVIDVENLLNGAVNDIASAERLWEVYRRQAPAVFPTDVVVVSAGRTAAHLLRGVFIGKNVKWVIGQTCRNGADRALINAVNVAWAAKNFNEIIIASGDGAFAPLAERAKRASLRIQVVTTDQGGHSSLARELGTIASVRTRIRSSSLKRRKVVLETMRQIHQASRDLASESGHADRAA